MRLRAPSTVRPQIQDRLIVRVGGFAEVNQVGGGAAILQAVTIAPGFGSRFHLAYVWAQIHVQVALAAGQIARLDVQDFDTVGLGIETLARLRLEPTAAINSQRQVVVGPVILVQDHQIRLSVAAMAAGAGTFLSAGAVHGFEYST